MKKNVDSLERPDLSAGSTSNGGAPSFSRWRYERKFIARGMSAAHVLGLIRRHPSAFGEAYPSRTINNVYFDSASLHDYFEHVSGAAQRVKTRIRWYGRLRGTIDEPTLEQKIKRGLVNGKQSFLLPPLYLNGSIDRDALVASFDRADLPPVVRSRLRHLQPVLVNRYRRYYLESADHRFRLTVDAELEFYRATAAPPACAPAARGEDLVILELKFDPEQAEAATAVTNAFPFRLNRCSKYVLGIEQLQFH